MCESSYFSPQIALLLTSKYSLLPIYNDGFSLNECGNLLRKQRLYKSSSCKSQSLK